MSTETNSRAAAVKAERRRRPDGEADGRKLYVDPKFKREGFVQRWINDDPRRIYAKTEMDDWEIIKNPAIAGDGPGTPVERVVGKTEAGQPLKAFLCEKPEKFYKEDKAKMHSAIDSQEEGLRRGIPADPGGLQGPTAYVPGGRNIVNGR